MPKIHLLNWLICSIFIFSNCQKKTAPIPETEKHHEDTVIIDTSSEAISPPWSPPPSWTEIKNQNNIRLDLRYATKNNFVKKQLYNCSKCYLRSEVASSILDISHELEKQGYGLILYDCYRPKPVQQALWDIMPNASYVTPPHRGSMHNRGLAIDIGLMDANGKTLDMGTDFDYFGKEAHTDYFHHTEEVLQHRKLQTQTLEKHGFKGIRTEWWHFSMPIEDYALSDWIWPCD